MVFSVPKKNKNQFLKKEFFERLFIALILQFLEHCKGAHPQIFATLGLKVRKENVILVVGRKTIFRVFLLEVIFFLDDVS